LGGCNNYVYGGHRLRYLIILFLLFATPAYATNYCDHANAIICVPGDEGTGDAVDQSSNSNDCTPTEGATWDGANTAGSYSGYGMSTVVDSGDAYWDCGNNASIDLITLAADFTLMFWIDYTSVNSYDRHWVIGNGGTDWFGLTNDGSTLTFIVERSDDQDGYNVEGGGNSFPTGGAFIIIEYDWSEDDVKYWVDCVDQTGWVSVNDTKYFTAPAGDSMCFGSRCGASSTGGDNIYDEIIVFDAIDLGVCNDIRTNGLLGAASSSRRSMMIK
jgi:hypothetical protein